MSECLLDDLVPQARFNKVTLESVSTTGGGYRVICDVSIFDTVSTEGDILTHFFSEDFKKYFELSMIVARDSLAIEAMDIIQGLGLEEYEVSRLVVLLFVQPIIPRDVFLNIEYVPSVSAINRLQDLFSQMTPESFESFITKPTDATNPAQNTGFNKFDDQGNIVYDFKVSREDQPKFINSLDVEQCRLFLLPVYNFAQAMQDAGLTYTEDLSRFAYGAVYSMDVLVDKQIVDSRVQDFRLIQRVVDFINPDLEVLRENRIAMLQKALGKIGGSNPNSNITVNTISPLMSTFGMNGTKNFFIIDIGTILYRNSSRKFMYANYEEEIDSSVVSSIRVRKDRVDVKKDPVFITNIQEKNIDAFSTLSYCFEDQEQLDVGEYSYTLEMTLVEPLQQVVEGYVYDIQNNLLPKLQHAKEYLNNTREYNSLRQELSPTGIQKMGSILNNATTKESHTSFTRLFKLLTGEVFGVVCPSIGRIRNLWISPSPVRLVDSLIKVINDVLFETSKFYEISAILNDSSKVSPSSLITISHTFRETVDYGDKSRGLYDVIEETLSGIDLAKSQFRERMRTEGEKFVAGGYSDFQNLGYLTPNKFNNLDLRDLDESKDAFFSFFSTSVDGAENPNIKIDKALQDPENSNISRHALRKDHATFESFASTLGLSVENRTVRSKRAFKPASQMRTRATLGIDYGTNSLEERNNNFLDIGRRQEEDEKTSRADRKTSILERRSKEEELISRFLNSTDGYDVFRRKSIAQGDFLNSRFRLAGINQELHTGDDVPVFLQDNGLELILRESSSIFESLYKKVYANNVYIVQYLHSVKDENGNMVLQWRNISDFDNVPDNVLCRLERYRNELLYVSDSYIVDREIMSKYFYLTN